MILSPPLTTTVPPRWKALPLLPSTALYPKAKTLKGSGSRYPPLSVARCSLGAEVPITAEPSASETGSAEDVEAELEKATLRHLLDKCLSSSYSFFTYLRINKTELFDQKQIVYRCRFLAILAVFGSLVGSLLCFVKGCTYVFSAFGEYFVNRPKVIMLLVEAIDIYLLGTVMLVFGMGLYELFVSTIDTAKMLSGEKESSNLFGLFALKERPQWLEIKSVNQLKTKLGHVIVMLLLIGFFEKSKTAAIHTPMDLLFFSASVLLCAGCLYLLSTLKESKG